MMFMVGKNNLHVIRERQGQKYQRYSIRRLNVGIASVAVAAGLMFTQIAL